MDNGNDEITFGRKPMHPLEHSTDKKPGNRAGGAGVGTVQIVHYYATEIDKYAVQTTQHNFSETNWGTLSKSGMMGGACRGWKWRKP